MRGYCYVVWLDFTGADTIVWDIEVYTIYARGMLAMRANIGDIDNIRP